MFVWKFYFLIQNLLKKKRNVNLNQSLKMLFFKKSRIFILFFLFFFFYGEDLPKKTDFEDESDTENYESEDSHQSQMPIMEDSDGSNSRVLEHIKTANVSYESEKKKRSKQKTFTFIDDTGMHHLMQETMKHKRSGCCGTL